jgi:predicted GIY-YIG superfamily endonuclease
VVADDGVARLREKQVKRGSKKQRVRLIEKMNPDWVDLYEKL